MSYRTPRLALYVLALILGSVACESKKKGSSETAASGGDANPGTDTSPMVEEGTGTDISSGTETDISVGTDVAVDTSTETSTTTSTGGAEVEGKSWDECYSANKAWYPAPAPAKCGDGTLVTWPCCKEQVLARFGLVKSDLTTSFNNAASYVLYACETLPGGDTRIHWKKDLDNGLSYRWTTIPKSAATTPSGTLSCAIAPAVPPSGSATTN